MTCKVALLSLLLLVSACSSTLNTTPRQVEADVSAALKQGATTQEIEAYLRQRGLEFSYDKYANRYQAIIRQPQSTFNAITIHILLDEQKTYSGVEAEDSYTFL